MKARPWVDFLSLFLPFALLYLLTPNQIFSFDAVTNAMACESGDATRWFHPNHLLYPSAGVLWYRFENLLGYTGYSIYSLARFNALLGAATLGLLHVVFSRVLKRSASAVLCAALGSTFAVWHFSVDGRALGLAVFFAAGVIALTFLMNERGLSVGRVTSQVLLSAGYIWAHAIAVFHVLPVTALVWWWGRSRGKGALWAAAYAAGTVALVALFYGAIYALVARPHTELSFVAWSLGYVSFEGTDQALKSGFWSSSVGAALSHSWSSWTRALLNPGTSAGAGMASQVFGLLIVGLVGVALARSRRGAPERRPLMWALFAWGALAALFVAFWSPAQEGFRLHTLLPWTALLAVGFSFERSARSWVALAACGLFCVNFTQAIFPACFIKNNPGYRMLAELQQRLNPGDTFVGAQSGVIPDVEVLRSYFFQGMNGGTVEGRLFAFRETSLAPLNERLRLQTGQGRSLYFSDDMFQPDVHARLEKRFGLRAGDFADFVNQFVVVESFPLTGGPMVSLVRFRA